MLNNRYVNLYKAQYLGCLSLAPCYASINIGNLFENFVWKLDIYIYICRTCLFLFLFLFLMFGLFDNFVWLV